MHSMQFSWTGAFFTSLPSQYEANFNGEAARMKMSPSKKSGNGVGFTNRARRIASLAFILEGDLSHNRVVRFFHRLLPDVVAFGSR